MTHTKNTKNYQASGLIYVSKNLEVPFTIVCNAGAPNHLSKNLAIPFTVLGYTSTGVGFDG